jgi:ATP-dependent protease ClpP protease subunit
MSDIKLSDDQRNEQPLLESHGIIIASVEIDGDAYVELSWALHLGRALHPEKPLELRCHGHGGLAHAALAIADLIIHDGNVDGIAMGEVASAHSYIWAACNRRYVYPNALLGVHRCWATGTWAPLQGAEYRMLGSNLDLIDRQAIRLYAKQSNKSKKWWRQRLALSSPSALLYLDAHQLIHDLEMARPIKERSHV